MCDNVQKLLALQEDLAAFKKTAEDAGVEIGRAKAIIDSSGAGQRNAIEGFNSRREELIRAHLLSHELIWCTRCSQVVPVREVRLMLFEGTNESFRGYGDSERRLEWYSRLMRVCRECGKYAKERHGGDGDYRQKAEGTFFHAFSVRTRNAKFYVRRFTDPRVEIGSDVESMLDKLPDFNRFKYLVEEWGVPARITTNGIDQVVDVVEKFE